MDTAIPGYKLYCNDRADQIGGGVALYVREGIESERIKVLQETKFDVESLWIEIPCKKTKAMAVGVYYRSPGQNEQMDDEMLKEIKEANKSYSAVII